MSWSWFAFLCGVIAGLIIYGFGLAYWMAGVNACIKDFYDMHRELL